MTERHVVLDQPLQTDAQAEALRRATNRAQAAEEELARLRAPAPGAAARDRASDDTKQPAGAAAGTNNVQGGVSELRKDSMMAHLLDSLDAGKDIGHYGRLVFAMVARHFLPHEEVVRYLMQDRDFSAEQAALMLRQVEGRDYNPPRRDRIVEWQSQQEFPILPNPEDPDCGNLYRNLKFPTEIYEHIGHYQEEKLHAEE